ncbi:MAG: prefoldin subunit alpha [Candidatus Micrarchaeia archaeon]|jgi:prefoldin alpha subunit
MDGDASRIAYELQYYQSQAQEMEKQLSQVGALLQENEASLAALDAIIASGNAETLSPIGTGVFVKMKISDSKKFLVDIGGRIIAEKTAEEARAVLEARKKNAEGMMQKLEKNFEEIARRMQALSSAQQAAGHSHEHHGHEHEHKH